MLTNTLRSALALAGAFVIASCTGDDNNRVLGPVNFGATDNIFSRYVAIGNSITAGYGAGGINDATQRASFAALLAGRMGTRYAYPSLAGRGCRPPVTNFQTQVGTVGSVVINATDRLTICDLRNANTTDLLTNVAVPGAASYDPADADGTPFSTTLTTLFLGGKSQVQRALENDPTFATIWIGNNDVLGFALSDGREAAATGLAGMTSVATFQANYTAMLDELMAGAPNLRGVLIGVAQVGSLPIMFPAAALQNAAFKAGFDAIANTTTTLDASCDPTGSGFGSLINVMMAFQIRNVGAGGGFPSTIACTKGGESGLIPAPVGDVLVLDAGEQALITARVNAYNAHIQAEAARIGFAYYDPNPTLVALRTAGTVITNVPTLGATGTFGTGMSLDGVHPGPTLHRTIANELIPVINAKYGTTLTPVP